MSDQFENLEPLTTREAREAPHAVDCWDCGEERVIDDDCIVEECPRCKDGSYEYDVPGPLDEQWAAKAETFNQTRRDLNEEDRD